MNSSSYEMDPTFDLRKDIREKLEKEMLMDSFTFDPDKKEDLDLEKDKD